jgi:hypothetical protein
MRITSLALLTLAISGAAWAAPHSETTTYVDGNVAGLEPNTGGTLNLADDTGITLRTGLTTVEIPYSGVSHAELGAVKETAHGAPLYKVWEINRRFAHKTQTQLLILNFKNEAGEEKNMTLELAKASAENTLATIESHTSTEVASAHPKKHSAAAPKKETASADDSWWGDTYWKTKSNQGKWSKPSGTAAPDQQ